MNIAVFPLPISLISKSLYDNISDNDSPISQIQNVIIVYCSDGSSSFNRTKILENYCRFEIGFYSNIDSIKLIENQLFSQYLDENEEELLRINYYNLKPKKIFIDLLIHSGDADLEVDKSCEKDENVHKYVASNKIFYSIKLSEDKEENKKNCIFKIIAKKKSYYSIRFNLMNDESLNKLYNYLETGMDYLITIDPLAENSRKIIAYQNLKIFEMQPFVATFRSINCKVSISRIKIEK